MPLRLRGAHDLPNRSVLQLQLDSRLRVRTIPVGRSRDSPGREKLSHGDEPEPSVEDSVEDARQSVDGGTPRARSLDRTGATPVMHEDDGASVEPRQDVRDDVIRGGSGRIF